MRPLPIDASLPEIARALERDRCAVVVAEPGAGKTTRVPPSLALRPERRGAVVLLEPRRIAAIGAARRIAEERRWVLGEEVGYSVRFESRLRADSAVQVVTEGVLLRRLQADPFLDGVSTVILDEFHERSLEADLALGLLADVRSSGREDLEIVVMSATIDPAPVARFLGGAPVIEAAGRSFSIEISYRPCGLRERIESVIRAALEEHWNSARGHVLVFLPGIAAIRRTATELASFARTLGAQIDILHGSLSLDAQRQVFAPSLRRRIVLATNIAEASITIEGVDLVIDSGLVRVLRHDSRTGIDRLEEERVSRHSADQRAGRSGRTRPGRVVRLWGEPEHARLLPASVPAVRRVDLARAVLELLAWGVLDPREFAWLDAPDLAALRRAEDLLRRLGAIAGGRGAGDSGARLTEVGRALLSLPLHPRLAAILIAAAERGVLEPAAVLVALIEEREVLASDAFVSFEIGGAAPGGEPGLRLEASRTQSSDLLLRLELIDELERRGGGENAARALGLDLGAARAVSRTARDLVERARRSLDRSSSRPAADCPREDLLREVLLFGYADRVVRRRSPRSPRGLMVGGRGVILSERSTVRDAELFLAITIDDARRGPNASEARVEIASAIEESWLERHFPRSIVERVTTEFDDERERVRSFAVKTYVDLPLEAPRDRPADPAEAARVLAEEARRRGAELIAADEAASSLLVRARALAEWRPDLGLPLFDDALLGDLAAEASVGRKSLGEIRAGGGLVHLLKARIGPELVRLVDALAPEAITVPSGRRVRLRYESSAAPILAVKLQELFGLAETPRVGGGAIAVILHLLAPNGRPVQITQDLRSFWDTTYQHVRRELRGRYPKHPWPEDPWAATPTARTKNTESTKNAKKKKAPPAGAEGASGGRE